MKTLLELAEQTMLEVDEEIGDIELKAAIKSFINSGYTELAKRQQLEKVLTVTSNDGKITKPTDYYKGVKVIYDKTEIPFEQEGDEISVGKSGDMKLIYNYIPVTLTDNDVPVTNPGNEEFMIAYAKYKYFQKENKYNNAEVFKRDYETFKVKRIKKDLHFHVIR
jgi:hypothetical protein